MRIAFNVPALVAAVAFGGLIGVQTKDLYSLAEGKASEQAIQLSQLETFRANVDRIRPVKQVFESAFQRASGIHDMMALHEVMRLEKYNLVVDKDTLVLQSVEPAAIAGGSLGLLRVCIGTLGGALQVKAKTMEGLIDGIASLSSRRDIEMASYSLFMDEKTNSPTAALKDFCLLLRD